MTTTIKTQKYPGWLIEKVTEGGQVHYQMTTAGVYVIEVRKTTDGLWVGSLSLRSPGLGLLIAPIVPFSGPVADCTVEADRRSKAAARSVAFKTAPWGAESRKLRGDRSRQPGTALAAPRFARSL